MGANSLATLFLVHTAWAQVHLRCGGSGIAKAADIVVTIIIT